MDHFAGLDVSVKDTSVCIVDDTGRIVREVKVASEPEGPLSQWLFSALAEAGLPVICVETRHMEFAQVLVAHLGDTPEPLFATARLVPK